MLSDLVIRVRCLEHGTFPYTFSLSKNVSVRPAWQECNCFQVNYHIWPANQPPKSQPVATAFEPILDKGCDASTSFGLKETTKCQNPNDN
jgi:hypothetical protein